MRIIKDGSVFRITLRSSIGEFEPRLSFAVNSHEQMMRPRLEVGLCGLLCLFMESLQYINGRDLLETLKGWVSEYRRTAIDHLMRIAREVAAHNTTLSAYERVETTSAAAISMRALVIAPLPPQEREDWEQMIDDVGALIKRLQNKPENLRGAHWFSPGSILNAYREGDMNFDRAVSELEKWKGRH